MKVKDYAIVIVLTVAVSLVGGIAGSQLMRPTAETAASAEVLKSATMETESLRIVNKDGRIIACLGADSAGSPRFTRFDSEANELEAEIVKSEVTETQNLRIVNKDGRLLASLGSDPAGGPRLSFFNSEAKELATVSIDKDAGPVVRLQGTPSLDFSDPDGNSRLAIAVSHADACMHINAAERKPILAMCVRDDGKGDIVLRRASGDIVQHFQLP